MLALNQARHVIRQDPHSAAARCLLTLIEALESGQSFPLKDLYSLDYANFQIALELLQEWRLYQFGGFARNGHAASRASSPERRKARAEVRVETPEAADADA